MPTVTMLCGLPGSGKSYYADNVVKESNNIVKLSSDDLRLELYGDVNDQTHNGEVFAVLYGRARQLLENNVNVIIDATNLNRSKRIDFVRMFKRFYKEIVYFYCPYDVSYTRNFTRERVVPEDVFDRMYKNAHVPSYLEGWDSVEGVGLDSFRGTNLNINTLMSYDEFEEYVLHRFHELYLMIDFPQDSKHHTLSLSRHTYYVYKDVFESYYNVDRQAMILAAIMHDIGKPYCKSFNEGDKYAHYYQHENVSAQLAYRILRMMDYEIKDTLMVTDIIQLHMWALNVLNGGNSKKLKSYVGEDMFEKLMFFAKCDQNAK